MDSVAVPFLLDNVPSFKFFSRRFILSNHFVHTFNINLDCYGQISVMSSEHAYFLLKATHFGDMASFHHIRYAPTPAAEKRLGRRIMPFVEQQWHAVRFEMMCRALRAKFAVEPLRRALQTSGYGPLVKASKDEYWAAGREMHEIGLTATANWLGQNALGEALMLIWEEVRTHPPTPNNLVRHYVVAQASAEDYVIVAASFDHEPFFIRVGNDMLQGLDFPRNLAVGDTLVIVSYYWRAAFERVAQIGHPTLPGWLHQGQIVRQAEAQSVQSVALVLSFIMPGVVRATNNGRHQGHRIVCSINVLVNGRVHTLAKRNMHENAIEHLEVSQNVHLHVMEVSAGWWCARNYILPPNALLGTGMEWQSEGRLKGKRKGEKEERERREWMKGKMEVEEARLKGSGKQESERERNGRK
ncbi:hypothetical protein niasHS_004837 [Heterodera schachtii]|uniref:NADAR domain-containing protein n=1 Tax=Heterodera schachtii TaxID=97005 RepID=A0ABD2IRU7_HETSC